MSTTKRTRILVAGAVSTAVAVAGAGYGDKLNTGNNGSLRKIVLGGTPERRTLKVPPVHGIEG